MSTHRAQKVPVTKLGGACDGDLKFTYRKKANMTIITSSHRGTPARPYAELVTHIHTSGGDIYVVTSSAGATIEVRAPNYESAWISLSDSETQAVSEALVDPHVRSAGRPWLDATPMSKSPAEEVRAA